MLQRSYSRTQMTQAGKVALEEELEYLRNVRRVELADWVKAAREGVHGDLADAAELAEAQREQDLAERRIADLERVLEEADVVQPPSPDKIGLGSTVTFRDDDGVDELTIAGPVEAAFTAGRMSIDSPVGGALLGHKAGESIEVETPAGHRWLKILKVA